MKTIFLKPYKSRLADLNDQLCFYLFNREELRKKLENYSQSANNLFTTDLFALNPYSKKIHVTFQKLPDFQAKNEALNYGAYFSFSYEFLFGYINNVIKLMENMNGITFTSGQLRKPIEEQLKIGISQIASQNLNDEVFLTVSYMRLRRNYFTHILKSLNNKFATLINRDGISLNQFWQRTISNLDFTSIAVDNFEESETIELLNIIKILLKDIDEIIGQNLNRIEIANYCATKIYATKPTKINSQVVNKRISKIKGYAKSNFGVTLLNSEIENAAKTIGIRT